MNAAVQLLTGDEHEAIHLAGNLADKLKAIVGTGPQADNDWNEIVPAIHQIQGWVMAQAAARAYPTRYRLKGQTIDRDLRVRTECQVQRLEPGDRFTLNGKVYEVESVVQEQPSDDAMLRASARYFNVVCTDKTTFGMAYSQWLQLVQEFY